MSVSHAPGNEWHLSGHSLCSKKIECWKPALGYQKRRSYTLPAAPCIEVVLYPAAASLFGRHFSKPRSISFRFRLVDVEEQSSRSSPITVSPENGMCPDVIAKFDCARTGAVISRWISPAVGTPQDSTTIRSNFSFCCFKASQCSEAGLNLEFSSCPPVWSKASRNIVDLSFASQAVWLAAML